MDTALGALLLLGLLLLWWHSAVQARERARYGARDFCQRQNWQLLDQTVALVSMRPIREFDRWQWLRRYRFDFSPDGDRRCSGELTLLGNVIQRVTAELPDGGRLIE